MVRIVVTVLNVIMMIALLTCSKNLRWSKDKATIIGFGFMTALYMANNILIWR